MTVHRIAKAQLDLVQSLLSPQIEPGGESTVANVEAATTEHDEYLLRYRARVFRVPPVPYKQGLWLLALDQELRRLGKLEATQENVSRTYVVVEDMLTIFHQLVRPHSLFDKLFWRWRANPFLHAEIGEINVMRGFFCSARTNSSVALTSLSRAPRFLPQIWPRQRPGSPIGILAGWDRMDTPVAGDITSSA